MTIMQLGTSVVNLDGHKPRHPRDRSNFMTFWGGSRKANTAIIESIHSYGLFARNHHKSRSHDHGTLQLAVKVGPLSGTQNVMRVFLLLSEL